METKPWHSSYPDGVPFEIDADSYASFSALCLESCRENGDRVAIVNQGQTLSFSGSSGMP